MIAKSMSICNSLQPPLPLFFPAIAADNKFSQVAQLRAWLVACSLSCVLGWLLVRSVACLVGCLFAQLRAWLVACSLSCLLGWLLLMLMLMLLVLMLMLTLMLTCIQSGPLEPSVSSLGGNDTTSHCHSKRASML